MEIDMFSKESIEFFKEITNKTIEARKELGQVNSIN